MLTSAAAPSNRWMHPTTRSDITVTWHNDNDVVVMSLWRGGECVASAPLTIADAASLTSFLVGHLGDRASDRRPVIGPVVLGPPRPRRALWASVLTLLGFARRRQPDRALDDPTDRLTLLPTR